MKKQEILEKWWGPFPAIVTPFDEKGRIVPESFRTLVASYVEDGVRGIIVGGHNGESWALKPKDLEELVALAVDEVKNQLPILCGIEGRSPEDVVETARIVEGAGAEGIMVEPPYIVTTSTDAEIIDRFERIANKSPLPIMMYNNPRRTQVGLKPAVVAQLAKHENIAAIKESTRDFGEFTLKLELSREDINIFVGPATFILPGVLYGAKGFVSTGPMELMRKDGRRLYDLAAAGKVEEAIPLQFTAAKIYIALFGLGTWPAALKAAMNALGRSVGIPRLPIHPLGQEEVDHLTKTLREIGILT
jgi:4-hydroxy-tetrahydrodipicolinate synthase